MNDPMFYKHVIKMELPPYDFKIHLFLDPAESESHEQYRKHQDEIIAKMISKLNNLGAKNIKDSFLKDLNKNPDKPKTNDKLRFIFTIDSEEEAQKCYQYFLDKSDRFHQNKKGKELISDDGLGVEEQMMIYLQKEEEVFVKYGDEEAKLYYMA